MANHKIEAADGVVAVDPSSSPPQKIIIDTDPGIDDSMAIMMAFQMASLEILGLTTVFGNVSTQDATNNALLLDSVRSLDVQMSLLQKVALSL